MSITGKDYRILLIDGALETFLEKSRQDTHFNLYEELARMGFTEEEITAAAIRKMEKMRLILKQTAAQLIRDYYSQQLRS